ncbi:MAG TPA: peptidylprolyl isomerase [Terriglobales bacterium]|nr:peptidylprolyl isomerase [Terriglobales bacterium]
MRTFVILLIVVSFGVASVAQTSGASSSASGSQTTHKSTPSATTHKSTAAKPAAAARPTAVIDTSQGQLTCLLFPEKAPNGVKNFIGLATGTKDWMDPKTNQIVHGKPLYDGTVCHRIIPEFMIQCGDPLGNGMGGPGYQFDNEVSPDLKFDVPGLLAYANSGQNEHGGGTNGSQFFITERGLPEQHQLVLNGNYTIFGQCTPHSVEVVKQIARGPIKPGTSDQAADPAVIKHITILNWKPTAPKPGVRKPRTPQK